MGEGGGLSDACRLRARGRQKHGVRTPPSRVSSILKGSFSKSVSTREAGECGSPAEVYPHVLRGMRRPGECGGPEGYLQGQVRHPSVACGDTSPCRGGFRGGNAQKGSPCKGSWMRRKAQTEGCIAGWRWRYPARSGRAFPRSTRRCRKAPRRARSPALHCDRKRAATRKRQPASRPDGGPMQASAPTQGRAAVRKDLTPVFRRVRGGRESAATRKGICRIRCGTPPSPAATPPLTGEASGGGNAQKGAPARGAFQAAVCSKPPPR